MPISVAAQVAALTAIVERIDSRAEEDRRDRKAAQAETERTRMITSAELAAMRHGQGDVLRRLDKIEPVTDLVTSFRAKIAGALIVLGFIGGVVWGGATFFKDFILGWFQ
jgi:hypothetical protein